MHQTDTVADTQRAFHHPDVYNNAHIAVVHRVEDQTPQRRVHIPHRRGDLADDRVHHVADVQPRFRRYRGTTLRGNADHVLDLRLYPCHIRGGQVDLVHHRYDLQTRVYGKIRVC